MVLGSVLTAAELQFLRTSSWSMVNIVDSLYHFSFQFIRNRSAGGQSSCKLK